MLKPLKPGWQTSELYLAALSMILGVFVAKGTISQAQQESILQNVPLVIGGVGALWISFKPILAYIDGRFRQKVLHNAAAGVGSPPLP